MIFIAPIALILAPIIAYILNHRFKRDEKYDAFLDASGWTISVSIIAFISLLSNKAIEYELSELFVDGAQVSFFEVETEDGSGLVKDVVYPTEDIRNVAGNFRVLFFLILCLCPYLTWQILNRKYSNEYLAIDMHDIGLKLCMTILLLSCLAAMPHWYYEIMKWSSVYIFITLIRRSNKRNDTVSIILYLALLWLFNPIEPVVFTKPVWNAIDVLVSVLLILLSLMDINGVFLQSRKTNN